MLKRLIALRGPLDLTMRTPSPLAIRPSGSSRRTLRSSTCGTWRTRPPHACPKSRRWPWVRLRRLCQGRPALAAFRREQPSAIRVRHDLREPGRAAVPRLRPEGRQALWKCYKSDRGLRGVVCHSSEEHRAATLRVQGRGARRRRSLPGQAGLPLRARPGRRPISVILDWKVHGYCSKYGASPSKGYMLCRDGYLSDKPSRAIARSTPTSWA